jgi:hypothetical protein
VTFGIPARATARASTKLVLALERALLVVALVVVASRFARDVALGAFGVWSSTRLSFAAALVRGIEVYQSPPRGLVSGDLYGPVMSFFYLPALLVPGVTGKIIVAELMSALVLLGPATVLVTRRFREQSRREPGLGVGWAQLGAAVVLVSVSCRLPSTMLELTTVIADAPCIGLGLLSYVVLLPRRGLAIGSPGTSALVLAALLVALAGLAKPHAIFVAVAEAFLVLRAAGLRRALVFVSAYAVLLPLAAGALLAPTSEDFAAYAFNTMVLPRGHGFVFDRANAIQLAKIFVLPLLALGIVTLFSLRATERRSALRGSLHGELWLMALALVPVSVAARLKVGGDANSLHAVFYAVVATTVAAVPAFTTAGLALGRALLFGTLAVVLGGAQNFRDLAYLWPLQENQNEAAFAYLKRHPNAHFPWHSLATLEATGRFDHHADGLHSRALARLPVTPEEFAAHAPVKPELVVMPPVGLRLDDACIYFELLSLYYPSYEAVTPADPALHAQGMRVFAASPASPASR